MVRNIQKYLLSLLFLVIIWGIGFGSGWIVSEKTTFERFVLEECWISKEGINRDVICIKEVN